MSLIAFAICILVLAVAISIAFIPLLAENYSQKSKNKNILGINLTAKQFLTIWFCFHLLALSVNLVPIKGTLKEPDYYSQDVSREYFFTSGYDDDAGFWPFVSYLDKSTNIAINNGNEFHVFHGIFYGYGISDFLFYGILGLGIVFVPKLLKSK